MFKSTARAAPRRILQSRAHLSSGPARRFLSTAPPPQKSRNWKSSAARWGLAAAGVYYYNTSNVFAEEPEAAIERLDESIHRVEESRQLTIDAIVEEKRQRQAQQVAEEQKRQRTAEAAATKDGRAGEPQEGEEGMENLEEEADQQGAFNPETGEINWDCPCLGGMAHGPCGEEFKAAFSCFVYSNEEPKGVECIEKFKGMQDCFRQHPEMYGSELEDDEDDIEEEIRARENAEAYGEAPAKSVPELSQQASKEAPPQPTEPKKAEVSHRDSQSTTAEDAQKAGDEGGELVPKAAYDASSK